MGLRSLRGLMGLMGLMGLRSLRSLRGLRDLRGRKKGSTQINIMFFTNISHLNIETNELFLVIKWAFELWISKASEMCS